MYNKANMIARARLKIQDSIGVLGAIGIVDKFTQDELNSIDVLEANNGYSSEIILRNRTVRNSEYFSVFSPNMVRSGLDPFAFAPGGGDVSKLQTMLARNENAHWLGSIGAFTPANGARAHWVYNYRIDWFEKWWAYEGISVDLGEATVIDTPAGLASFDTAEAYVAAMRNPDSDLYSGAIPPNETWIWAATGYGKRILKYVVPRSGCLLGVEMMYFGPSYQGSTLANAGMGERVHMLSCRMENSWQDLYAGPWKEFSGETWVPVIENEDDFGPLPLSLGNSDPDNPRTGGLRRLGYRWLKGVLLGMPPAVDAVTLEGPVTVTGGGSDPYVVEVGSGPRSLDWRGSSMMSIVGANETGSDVDTSADSEAHKELSGSRIRSYILNRQYTPSSGLLKQTKTYGLAKDGDIDLYDEIFQTADASKKRPQLTFRQAESRAVKASVSAWHVMDFVAAAGTLPGSIDVSGTNPIYSITVKNSDGATLFTGAPADMSDDDVDALMDQYWVNAAFNNSSSLSGSTEYILSLLLGVEESEITKYDSVPDGEKNEFNEAHTFAHHHDPMTLPGSTLAAQSIVQLANSRLEMGKVPASVIMFGRHISKVLGVNDIKVSSS